MTNELTPKQKRRLEYLKSVVEKGDLGIAEMIFELEDRIDEELPALHDVMKRLKGDPGEGYTITEKDFQAIARGAQMLVDLEKLADMAADRVSIPVDQIVRRVRKLIPTPKNGETPSNARLQALIKPLIPEPIPGDPGADADEEAMLVKIENDLPALGARIRDGLELLEGNERLEQSAIKDLVETLARIEKRIDNISQGRSGGAGVGIGGLVNTVRTYDLSPQCDGVTKTFQVPSHRRVVGLRSSSFPWNYRFLVDFTTGNKNLILTDEVIAPEGGQTLIFEYIK